MVVSDGQFQKKDMELPVCNSGKLPTRTLLLICTAFEENGCRAIKMVSSPFRNEILKKWQAECCSWVMDWLYTTTRHIDLEEWRFSKAQERSCIEFETINRNMHGAAISLLHIDKLRRISRSFAPRKNMQLFFATFQDQERGTHIACERKLLHLVNIQERTGMEGKDDGAKCFYILYVQTLVQINDSIHLAAFVFLS
jgi:hypothetical protein